MMRPLTRSLRAVVLAGLVANILAPVGAWPDPRVAAQAPRPGPGTTVRPGDRVWLAVEGEPQLSDTFAVRPNSTIELPVVGVVSLAGISRDRIERHLQTVLGAYLKQPVVHARVLLRIGVVGEVARPGFYALSPEAILSDALTVAGGPTQSANLRALRLERGTTALAQGKRLVEALAQSTTIATLGVESGDSFVVPRAADPERAWRIGGVVATIVAIGWGIARTR